MASILLVDDDPMIIKLYQVILKKTEYRVSVAINGREMLDAVGKGKPDVILLDVVLPDQSGLDLCVYVKKNKELSSIKIILVSGTEIEPSKVAQGIDIGADDYLLKPFNPKELLARVNNCLKLKKAEDALRDTNRELKKLSQHLQHVREEERQFFAREVQEEVGQLTAVLKMDIDWLFMNLPDAGDNQKERIRHASGTATEIINRIRKIASSLRPSMLDELGLRASLDWLCRQFTSLNRIPCSFTMMDDDEGLPSAIVTAIFRICQESLRNIQQHAEATRVAINASISEHTIHIGITYNGKSADIELQKNGLELVAIRERIQAINGKVKLESIAGIGATVTVVIPR